MSICPRPAKVKKQFNASTGKYTASAPTPRTEACNAVTTVTSTPSSTSTVTTVYVQGPAGPQGPQGKDGWGFEWESEWAEGKSYVKQKEATPNASVVIWGGNEYICIQDHTSSMANSPVDPDGNMEFRGEWTPGEVYTAFDANHKASTVTYGGLSWYCIATNIAEDQVNMPGAGGEAWWVALDTESGSAGEGVNFWKLYLPKGSNGAPGPGANQVDKSYLDQLMDFKDNVFDWVKNADLVDWLKAGAIAAGVIWAGSKVMDMMNPDSGSENHDARYNGSPGYSGAYTAPSLPQVVASLCEYSDITYDVSALPAEPVSFTIASATSIRNILEQLSVAFQFDCVNSGGVLKFVPRNTSPIKTITLADMGFSSSDQLPAPYVVKRLQGIDLPRYVSLTYRSEDVDYNSYTQSAELYTYTEGQQVALEVPVCISHEKAKAICETSLTNAHLERTNFKFNTTYKFIDVEPGDILNSEVHGLIRVLRVTENEEGILEFECSDAGVDAANMVSNTSPQLPAVSNKVVAEIGPSQAFWIDPTNLDDTDKTVRVYAAVHGYGKAGWPGAAIYMSEDGGASYEQIGTATKEATLGMVGFATESSPWHVWDNTTEIVVTLKTGTLLSKSEQAVLNGANRAQVGQEMIGFCNAQLIGEKTYKLTKLLRGRQGTEAYVGTHQANELFCLLDDALVRIELTDSDRATTKKFKVVTIGSSLDLVDAEDVQIISNNTMMWSVFNPKLVKSGTDFVLNFSERARFDNQLKDFSTTNHDIDWAGFGIAVLDSNNVVKKTFVVQGTSFTYTGTQQVNDFGSTQTHIKMSIVQMSQKWGGGFPTVINN